MLCGYPPDPNVLLHGPGVGAGVAVAQATQCLGEGQRFGNRLSQLLLSERGRIASLRAASGSKWPVEILQEAAYFFAVLALFPA
jgi:hypothetical protein